MPDASTHLRETLRAYGEHACYGADKHQFAELVDTVHTSQDIGHLLVGICTEASRDPLNTINGIYDPYPDKDSYEGTDALISHVEPSRVGGWLLCPIVIHDRLLEGID